MGLNHDGLYSMEKDNIFHQYIGTIVTTHKTKSDLIFYIYTSQRMKNVQRFNFPWMMH